MRLRLWSNKLELWLFSFFTLFLHDVVYYVFAANDDDETTFLSAVCSESVPVDRMMGQQWNEKGGKSAISR